MRKFLVLFSFCVYFTNFAQQDEVLVTIDDMTIKVSEFKKVYEKNIDLVQDSVAKNIDKYLELYIIINLKLNKHIHLA